MAGKEWNANRSGLKETPCRLACLAPSHKSVVDGQLTIVRKSGAIVKHPGRCFRALPALVIALFQGKQRTNYLLYIFFFPFFLGFIVARDMLDPKRWSAEILRLATGPIAAAIYLLSLAFIDLSMVASHNFAHVKVSVWLAIIANYLLVVVAMRFAIARTFLLTAPWILLHRLRTQFDNETGVKKPNTTDKKKAEDLQARIKTTMDAITQRVSNAIVFIFLAFFGFVFTVTVLNFACIYFSVRPNSALLGPNSDGLLSCPQVVGSGTNTAFPSDGWLWSTQRARSSLRLGARCARP